MKEQEAVKKDAPVENLSKKDGKCLLDGAPLPVGKRTRAAPTGSAKLLADASRVSKPKIDWLGFNQEQVTKSDLGKYWFDKYGEKGAIESESVINDLDEAIDQLGKVKESRAKHSGSAHAKMRKGISLQRTPICARWRRICSKV
ncbi:uncharacterized protein [Euphorbia lathyris]|uniref:uncharacterized protein n=1 Tax=Euphorbia lathyris TaxID=212925 RepID=UPI003313A119